MSVDSEQETTTAWVLRAGCGCVSSVSVIRYGSIEQAWAKMVGSMADQRRAVATGMTLSVQTYNSKLLDEIRRAVTCDHPPIRLREAINRVRKLAVEMRTWCSPYGVATTYANRLQEAIIGDTEPGVPRTTCPFCPPDLGEMDDVAFMVHIDTKHSDLVAVREATAATTRKITPERIATIIKEAENGFAPDTAAGGWMVAAGRRILDEIAVVLDSALAEHETEQGNLMHRRLHDGLPENAREHAIRTRAHLRDRGLVHDLLTVATDG